MPPARGTCEPLYTACWRRRSQTPWRPRSTTSADRRTWAAPAAWQGDDPAAEAVHEVARQTREARRRPSAPAAVRGQERGQGLVLVVEGNPEMNRFLAESLAPECRVATAFDGREGLEA